MDELLRVENLMKHHKTRDGTLIAVDGVSFEIRRGETVGLVGESGCGKSTLGKTICRIQEPTSGSIRLRGVDISRLSRRELRPVRRVIQFVFQDPYSSLNPRLPIGRILEEPLVVQRLGTSAERKERVEHLLQRVGLHPDAARRLPHEFSGGQRQRVGIARALVTSPELVICDEPVSALDVSIQAQILNLLVDLQRERGLSYLFISHDLSVVRYIADRVMIMYLGRIVEIAQHDTIWAHPSHPYTAGLIQSVPTVGSESRGARRKTLMQGELPSALSPPSGCRFHPRCPYAVARCRTEEPALREIGTGHAVACHLAGPVIGARGWMAQSRARGAA
jgi:oligopeptide/dipeptide ABC transporter ATP-binding protein